MRSRLSRLARSGAAPHVVALLASAIVGAFAIRAILEKAGRPAVPLDDAFIHFQFARRLAEGAPLRYTGDAASTGATSLAWPALLAPFWRAGARGLSLVWVAWAFGTIAHAGVVLETARLARRLTDGSGAVAAGAMCLVFGPFAWFAWSGMETMALAWALIRAARLAAETLEWGRGARLADASSDRGAQPRAGAPPLAQLAFVGFVAPLVRPEGALASLFAAFAIGLRGTGRRRALALIPIAGVLVQPLLFWALAGDPAGGAARVKWLLYNPYFDAGRLAAQIGYHARLLLFDVWDGGEWTWVFVPRGLVLAFLFGAAVLLRAGRRAPWSAAITIALFCGAFATCSYQTFLWNRIRYAWPFAPAGFVLCACLAHEIGQLLRRARAPLQIAAPILSGVIVARLAALLPDTFDDLATSARAVDRQQVKLGEWAKGALPADALVGVNDTGAIAYLGERRTFDIVGLTTAGQGAAWVAGAGSRYERFERLPRSALPTHFIVYPEWFGCDALLGAELERATVTDHAILGGDTMVAYEADFSLLGAGALPFAPPEGASLADEVDVADLESEAAHGFVLGAAWETEDIARALDPADDSASDGDSPAGRPANGGAARDRVIGRPMIDGGRTARARDSFRMAAPRSARDLRLVLRVAADSPITLDVRANAREVATIPVPASTWYEVDVPMPAIEAASVAVDVIASGPQGAREPEGATAAGPKDPGPRFASFHYWLYAR